jgi:hypothetical protein
MGQAAGIAATLITRPATPRPALAANESGLCRALAMMVDYGPAVAALLGGAVAVVASVAAIVRWRTASGESRRKIAGYFKVMPIVLVIGMLYFALFDHTPHGTACQKSRSPDGHYIAERCLLDWIPGGSSKYVGRLFDAKTGKKLAQNTFNTSDPDLSWSPGMYYSLGPESSYKDIGPSVGFSRGDPDDGDSGISLPPSRWDRLSAVRPRL